MLLEVSDGIFCRGLTAAPAMLHPLWDVVGSGLNRLTK